MPYQQVTLFQFYGLLDNRLGAIASTFWRQDEKRRYLNESLRVWNAITGYWKTRVRLGDTSNGPVPITVADQAWYDVPGTLTSGMRLLFNGAPLTPTSLEELDSGRRLWESESTTSGGDVPTTPTLWAPAGLTLVAIWPADAVGGNSLMADGVAVTPVLASDADHVDIGQEELNHLLDYCEHIAMFKEGGAEFQATEALFRNFLKGASSRNAMLLASSLYRKYMGLDVGRDRKKRLLDAERVGAR